MQTQKKLIKNPSSKYTVSMNTPTKANSKRSSLITKSYDKVPNDSMFHSPKPMNQSTNKKLEYSTHILPNKSER